MIARPGLFLDFFFRFSGDPLSLIVSFDKLQNKIYMPCRGKEEVLLAELHSVEREERGGCYSVKESATSGCMVAAF